MFHLVCEQCWLAFGGTQWIKLPLLINTTAARIVFVESNCNHLLLQTNRIRNGFVKGGGVLGSVVWWAVVTDSDRCLWDQVKSTKTTGRTNHVTADRQQVSLKPVIQSNQSLKVHWKSISSQMHSILYHKPARQQCVKTVLARLLKEADTELTTPHSWTCLINAVSYEEKTSAHKSGQ